MVASHGGSPSGRLTAVRGRSISPDLVPGLWPGAEVAGLVLLEGFLVAPDTLRPDAALGGEPGDVTGLDRPLVGDDVLGVNVFETVGVVVIEESPSSCKGILPVLPLRILVLSTGIPSSWVMLLLIVRFLTSGVSRSILS